MRLMPFAVLFFASSGPLAILLLAVGCLSKGDKMIELQDGSYIVTPTELRSLTRKKGGGQPITQIPQQKQQWGQQQRFTPPWTENEERTLVMLDAEPRTPVVKTLILALERPATLTGSFMFRWKLNVGVSGATATFIIDAGNLQQVSLPMLVGNISLVATALGEGQAFTTPSAAVKAVAFFADGTTSTAPAQYTERFFINPGVSQSVAVPAGATRFRILGEDGVASSPFTALTTYIPRANFGQTDVLTGAEIAAIRTQWIPATGHVRSLDIQNLANPAAIVGLVQWEIDL